MVIVQTRGRCPFCADRRALRREWELEARQRSLPRTSLHSGKTANQRGETNPVAKTDTRNPAGTQGWNPIGKRTITGLLSTRVILDMIRARQPLILSRRSATRMENKMITHTRIVRLILLVADGLIRPGRLEIEKLARRIAVGRQAAECRPSGRE